MHQLLYWVTNLHWTEILARYFEAIRQDGDYQNDWLTHLPYHMRDSVLQWGIALAQALGFS